MKRKLFYARKTYSYDLVKETRKTLSLTVYPDMSILVKTPFGTLDERIEDFLKRKWKWLERQLKFFAKYQRSIRMKEYVSGESFLYLGRQYKLQISLGEANTVKFYKGVLLITRTGDLNDNDFNSRLLRAWYKLRASEILKTRYEKNFMRFEYKDKPELVIRRMPKRWGSFLSNKKIVLNPDLIKASTDCIDYVITHELCHMRYQNHTKKYYDFLESKSPNWRKTKDKLEMRMVCD